jgi:hypothetical protein
MIAQNPDCEIVLGGRKGCHGDYRTWQDVVDYYSCHECNADVLTWASNNEPFIVGHEVRPTTHCLVENFTQVNDPSRSFGAVLFHHKVINFDYAYLSAKQLNVDDMKECVGELVTCPQGDERVKEIAFYSHAGLLDSESRYSISSDGLRNAELKPGRNYAFLSCANLFGEIFSPPFFFEARGEVSYYCLRGCGEVRMADGGVKRVDALAVDDLVRSVAKDGTTESSEVIARKVDRRGVPGASNAAPFSFVCVGRTWLTPSHPIRIDAKWLQPIEKGEAVEIEEEMEVFNFVLANRSSLFVNDLEVCTLGQFCDGIDKEDSFFGTERVVRHMQSNSAWPNIIS